MTQQEQPMTNTTTSKLTPTALDYHRNGISGAPFHVLLFRDGQSLKLGIVFEQPGHCAVLDVQKLAEGDIAFGSNSWRGDWFEPALRRAIREQNERDD
jgi:hypothetical protein